MRIDRRAVCRLRGLHKLDLKDRPCVGKGRFAACQTDPFRVMLLSCIAVVSGVLRAGSTVVRITAMSAALRVSFRRPFSQKGSLDMDSSILLARLIGPLFVAVGLGVLLNPTHYGRVSESFLTNSELYYLSGALAFVIGMAVILHHNLWVADWRVIITITGWISLIKGTARILLPAIGARLAASLLASKWSLNASAIVLLVAGAWLSYEGFRAG